MGANKLGLMLQSGPGGYMLADLSSRVRGARFGTGLHGFDTFTGFLPCNLVEQFYLYDRPGLPHLTVTGGGATAYEGRLEDVAIVDGGVKLTAFGYWRALSDAPYTGQWSSTHMDDFKPLVSAGWTPEKYSLDTNERLFIGLVKGNVYTNAADIGSHLYKSPHSTAQLIKHISVTYSYVVPANWVVRLVAWNDGLASAVASNITTTGGTNAGTHTWDLSATPREWWSVEIFNNSGASPAYAGETGVNFLTISALRAKGTISASLYADEIADALVAFVNGINSTQLSASTALIDSPAIDLKDEIYQDAYPADILDYLAGVGDNSTPAQLFEAMVWEGRQLTFRQRLSAARKHWYVDVSSLEVERTLETLRNSVYATYQEVGGRTLRTVVSADANSIARYGLTRRMAALANTTSSTDATNIRNLTLNDRKNPKPRAGIVFDALYDGAGTRWPKWIARAGDRCTIRNLPPTLSTDVDRIRTFLLAGTDYDIDTDTLDVTPEAHRPRVDLLLARLGAGVKQGGLPNSVVLGPGR